MSDLKKGDKVKLLTMPDGYSSRWGARRLTIGNVYTVLDFEGSNVWTDSDEPGHKESYWRGRVEKVEPPTEFIAHDWCGWNDQYGRYTHMPSGKTLVCKGWWGQLEWDQEQFKFLSKFPGLNVHSCPTGSYSANGKLMGTTDEICERLRARFIHNPLRKHGNEYTTANNSEGI